MLNFVAATLVFLGNTTATSSTIAPTSRHSEAQLESALILDNQVEDHQSHRDASIGCSNADLAQPFGQLDFFDVSRFLSGFASMESFSDINGDELWDFFDISGFLASFTQGCPVVNVVTFDNGVTGASLTPIGIPPSYHETTHVVRGTPSVTELSSTYPNSGGNVFVLPATLWDDGEKIWDIIPVINSSRQDLDIWFGDPTTDGTRVIVDISGADGLRDILATDPVAGYTFSPERVYVVGERLYAWCSVFEDSAGRRNKMALVSAAMTDVRDQSPNPWTLHVVTNQFSDAADRCGQPWSMSHIQEFEGKLWSVGVDYASPEGIEGGQVWIVGYELDGTYIDCVRLYTRVQANTHSHNGCILYDGNNYSVMFHYGDSQIRLYRRQIPSILAFADSATEDPESGIGGLYRNKDASLLDWSPATLSGGIDEGTTLANSNWPNALILTVDPHDNSKFIYGADTGSGLLSRMSLDSNGIAIAETMFNPVARSRANLGRLSHQQQLLLLLLDKSGPYMAGLVSNVINGGSSKPEYSGVVYSDDGGLTWSWIWRGAPDHGTVSNEGIAVLQSGSVLIGSIDPTASVRCITPGAKLTGQPLFVGYKPKNYLGNASAQRVLTDESGAVVSSGESPLKPLPFAMHNTESFLLHRTELANGGQIEIVNLGIPEAALNTSNLYVTWWERKLTPTGTTQADRVGIGNSYQLVIPGASLGNSPYERSPTAETISDDWNRYVMMYYPLKALDFLADPSDLRIALRGPGGVATTGNSELFLEAVNIGINRPGLPSTSLSEEGISSGKIENLSLGTTWTILVSLQIPQECWDSWTGAGSLSGQWSAPAPVFSISDSTSTNAITFQGMMDEIARGGRASFMTTSTFNWGIYDTDSTIVSPVRDYPLRTVALTVAISKSGTADIQYAVGTPSDIVTGSRPMPSAIDADILRFCDINETDALEMYIHQVSISRTAMDSTQLQEIVRTMTIPASLNDTQPRSKK